MTVSSRLTQERLAALIRWLEEPVIQPEAWSADVLVALKELEAVRASPPAVSGPILVWCFHDAPKEYQELSRHGGDEDWLALVPKRIAGEYIGWLESGSRFGCCDVSEHPLENGDVVHIGAHA